MTRIRVGRSSLNQHKFTIGLSDSPECFCHFKVESPEHFFLDCFLFSLERQRLFDLIEHYVPYFKRLNKKQKLELILRGVNIENQELLSTNITLTKEVQQYILSTKRFTAMENELWPHHPLNSSFCSWLLLFIYLFLYIFPFYCTYTFIFISYYLQNWKRSLIRPIWSFDLIQEPKQNTYGWW